MVEANPTGCFIVVTSKRSVSSSADVTPSKKFQIGYQPAAQADRPERRQPAAHAGWPASAARAGEGGTQGGTTVSSHEPPLPLSFGQASARRCNSTFASSFSTVRPSEKSTRASSSCRSAPSGFPCFPTAKANGDPLPPASGSLLPSEAWRRIPESTNPRAVFVFSWQFSEPWPFL